MGASKQVVGRRWKPGQLVLVAAVKGGNGGCCQVPTCFASINQWEWHFGEVLGKGDAEGGDARARGCQEWSDYYLDGLSTEENGEDEVGPGHFWWMVSMMVPRRLPVCHFCRSVFLCLSAPNLSCYRPTLSPRLGIHIQVVKPLRHRRAKKPWRELSSCPLYVGKY